MKETIDWEEMMASAERSAKTAARLTERSIGGVAQVIETQRRHSSELAEIKQSLAEIALRPQPRPSPVTTLASLPPPARWPPVWPSLWTMAAVFAAGIASGAYFVS